VTSTPSRARHRVALAASAAYSGRREDESLLAGALSPFDIDAEPVVWSDATDWNRFDAVVVGACWDYHLRHQSFLSWTRALEDLGAALWNPAETLRWNHHKSYLLELAARGIPVVPTRFFKQGEAAELAALFRDFDAERMVIKPAISASAHRTWILNRADERGEAELRAAISEGDTLAQPFVAEIAADGEWSLVFIDRRYSHAVLKRPAAGEFRSQLDYGGSAIVERAPRDLVDFADGVLAAADHDALYARVDLVVAPAGLLLMEFELIEPELFLRYAPGAAERLAEAIARRLRARAR
jgi:glutathione synthase/RimK-type ligase-like ATP-grasp enzyme